MPPNRIRVLLGLFVVAAVLTMTVLTRVLPTVFFAVTVAYVLYPVRRALTDRGYSRRLAAAGASLVGLVAVLAVTVPILGALYVRRREFVEFIRDLPPQVVLSAYGFEYPVDVSAALTFLQRWLTDLAVDIASAAPVLALKLTLFVLLVYALLLRPGNIARAVLALVPRVYHDIVFGFHERVRSTLNALYILQAVTAFVTFLVAYPLFAILGYESALVLSVFAGVLQFIPILGPSALILVLAGYQVVLGDVAAAVFLVTLGLVLIGFLPDALIRPRLASMTAGMPGSLYFVGFTGGVLTVGVIGFIAGPLVIALLLETGDLLRTEMGVDDGG